MSVGFSCSRMPPGVTTKLADEQTVATESTAEQFKQLKTQLSQFLMLKCENICILKYSIGVLCFVCLFRFLFLQIGKYDAALRSSVTQDLTRPFFLDLHPIVSTLIQAIAVLNLRQPNKKGLQFRGKRTGCGF